MKHLNSNLFFNHKNSVFILILILFCACKKEIIVPPVEYKSNSFLEESQAFNTQLLKYEESLIQQYIKNKGEKFTNNNAGVWLNNGAKKTESMANENDYVQYTIQIKSLAGELIYSFEETGIQDAILGKKNLTRGLHSALQYIEPNTTVTAIMPSSLAYGIYGDGNKIQTNEPLVYEIKMIQIKKTA